MSKKENFYITTAISYVNGVPHLGHAYESILTDAMARFKRLDGYNVLFLTGTDEHGEKVAKTADKHGMDPKDFADQNAAEFRAMTDTLNISNDIFIRTTEERHYEASKDIWKRIEANGDIYLGKYEGWYSVREEAYFTEDELRTSEDGQKFTPNGTEVEWVEEGSYFFKLSEYTDKLLDFYEKNPNFIQPETRRNEIIAFVKQGLRDLSISRHKRRLQWGIPVPGDDEHVMYVWLDALTNYITGAGYPDQNSKDFKEFWPASFHVIGKDITRFHTIYWPAFLMSAGVELPQAVFAHGFINVQGEKMSKSTGNVLSPDDLVELYGLDAFRYFLLREIPHGQDGNFSYEQAVKRINADLANGLGNLAQRTLSMIYKNCDQQIPEPADYTQEDQDLLTLAQKTTIAVARQAVESFSFHESLKAIWACVRAADRYVDEQAPWNLKKEDSERMKTVLYVLAETVRCLSITIAPFMPQSSDILLDQLEVPKDQRAFSFIDEVYALKAGTQIQKPEGVFPRIIEEDSAENSESKEKVA